MDLCGRKGSEKGPEKGSRKRSNKGLSRRHLEGRNQPFQEYDRVHPILRALCGFSEGLCGALRVLRGLHWIAVFQNQPYYPRRNYHLVNPGKGGPNSF